MYKVAQESRQVRFPTFSPCDFFPPSQFLGNFRFSENIFQNWKDQIEFSEIIADGELREDGGLINTLFFSQDPAVQQFVY